MRVRRKRRAHDRHLPKGPRIDVDACPRDILRRQFPPDLHDMSPGFGSGQRQTSRQDARSCGAPDFFRFKPGRKCRCRERLDRAGDVGAEGISDAPLSRQYWRARLCTTVRYPDDTGTTLAPSHAASSAGACGLARWATKIVAFLPSARATCAKEVWAPPSGGLA